MRPIQYMGFVNNTGYVYHYAPLSDIKRIGACQRDLIGAEWEKDL